MKLNTTKMQIRVPYLIALSFIAAISIVGFVIVHYAEVTETNGAYTINISGRQRMLSQRTALLASQLSRSEARPSTEVRTLLSDALALFEESHKILFNLSKQANHGDPIHSLYLASGEHLDADVQGYIQSVRETMNQPTAANIQNLQLKANLILPKLDKATVLFQQQSEHRSQGFVNLQTLFFVVTLAALAIVAFSIFLPMERRILRSQENAIHTSNLTTLGEMSTGMAHEINQPLAGISLAVQMIKKLKEKNRLSDEELNNSLQDIMAAVARSTKIIDHVRIFAKQEALLFKSIDINETIESALSLMGEQLKLRGIEISKNLSAACPKINADPNRLEQVWINLLANARDALDEGTEDPKKKISITTKLSGESVLVEIADNGIGMTDEVKKKVFEPFFTTKPVGKGTGLGMAIVHGIIAAHQGAIEIGSEPKKGTTLTVRLSCT